MHKERPASTFGSRVPALALGLSILLLALLAPGALAATKADFGDAPDGKRAGYRTAPGVVGHFPSKAATPGPRHSSPGAFFLGAKVSGEGDSAQVDRDRFDDGAGVSLKPCGSSTLKVVLNGAALPPATLSAGHVAYVNAWFDWNRDGDWADSSDGCSPEWAIQNLPVSMDKLSPDGIGVLPIGFTAGKHAQDIWERVTLTLDRPVSAPNGGGSASPYAGGETEDYLIPAGKVKPVATTRKRKRERERERRERERRRKEREKGKNKPPGKRGRFTVSCAPAPAVIPHGGVATVKFVIADSGKGLIFGSPPKQKGPGGTATVTPLKPQPKGIPAGYVAADGFKLSGSKVDPPLRVQTVVVSYTFKRGNQTQHLGCEVLIVHWAHVNPFLPRVVCEGTCRGEHANPTGALKGSGKLEPRAEPHSFFDVFFETDVNAFKVVLPPGNQVLNPVAQPPPGASYTCEPATSATADDSLLCTGNLPANVHAQGEFGSGPIAPGSARLYGRRVGSAAFEGPFALSGP